jgi:hypothetical protein
MAATDPAVPLAAFRQRYARTRFIDVALAELRGIPRGKRMPVDELLRMFDGSFLLRGPQPSPL